MLAENWGDGGLVLSQGGSYLKALAPSTFVRALAELKHISQRRKRKQR